MAFKVRSLVAIAIILATANAAWSAKLNHGVVAKNEHFSGLADYYADKFHGRRTASGMIHDRNKLTAAHRTLPFGTHLKVVNKRNGKSCVVVVNDRGPYSKHKVIDLSHEAAKQIGSLTSGTVPVDCYVLTGKEEMSKGLPVNEGVN